MSRKATVLNHGPDWYTKVAKALSILDLVLLGPQSVIGTTYRKKENLWYCSNFFPRYTHDKVIIYERNGNITIEPIIV